MIRRQGGVTTIEVAVAAVTLGMVAAFAVPRYAGLRSQARVSALSSLVGSVRSAANMGHGVWLANGNVSPITIDGKNIVIVNGYPDAAGIQAMVQEEGFIVKVSAPAATFVPDGAKQPAGCALQYSEAPTSGASFSLTYTGNTPNAGFTLSQSC